MRIMQDVDITCSQWPRRTQMSKLQATGKGKVMFTSYLLLGFSTRKNNLMSRNGPVQMGTTTGEASEWLEGIQGEGDCN